MLSHILAVAMTAVKPTEKLKSKDPSYERKVQHTLASLGHHVIFDITNHVQPYGRQPPMATQWFFSLMSLKWHRTQDFWKIDFLYKINMFLFILRTEI